jgi:hypothetical protein
MLLKFFNFCKNCAHACLFPKHYRRRQEKIQTEYNRARLRKLEQDKINKMKMEMEI